MLFSLFSEPSNLRCARSRPISGNNLARTALEQHGTDFKAVAEHIKAATGAKGKALFMPLRAALTGELDGPEMAKLLPLIGRERAQRRLEGSEKSEKSKEKS